MVSRQRSRGPNPIDHGRKQPARDNLQCQRSSDGNCLFFLSWLLLPKLEKELNPVGKPSLATSPVLLAELLPLWQIRDGVEELGSD